MLDASSHLENSAASGGLDVGEGGILVGGNIFESDSGKRFFYFYYGFCSDRGTLICLEIS